MPPPLLLPPLLEVLLEVLLVLVPLLLPPPLPPPPHETVPRITNVATPSARRRRLVPMDLRFNMDMDRIWLLDQAKCSADPAGITKSVILAEEGLRKSEQLQCPV